MDAAFEGGEIKGKFTVLRLYDNMGRARINKSIDFTINGDGERKIYEIDISALETCFVGGTLDFESSGHAKIYSFEFAE